MNNSRDSEHATTVRTKMNEDLWSKDKREILIKRALKIYLQ